VVVEDNVVYLPALVTSEVPFCTDRLVQPPGGEGTRHPPEYSGLASDDRTGWERFRSEYERTHRPVWVRFGAWVQQQARLRFRIWSSSTPPNG
jgi:hypothetical protein